MIKEQFLNNLEKALARLILNQIEDNSDPAARQRIQAAVTDFVWQNAAEYDLQDLVATFSSAHNALALFYEYQEARNLCDLKSALARQPLEDGGARAASALRRGGDRWQEPVTGMVFVWVAGGHFLMGSGDWDDQGAADEKPVHEVWLDGFWMGQYPVTVDQYRVFARQFPEHAPPVLPLNTPFVMDNRCGGCQDPGHLKKPTAGDLPVVGVSWNSAAAFGRWLSQVSGGCFRLPTEAEWEYAARSGGKPEKYPGGLAAADVAWFAGNSGGIIHAVGQRQPNGLGLYDMSGNVCEWCLDIYHRFAYERHFSLNPLFDSEGSCRVVRGGSFRHGAKDIRCADRGLLVPDQRSEDLGFRLVKRQ
jgi:formylglycine-generating enzyme required for sulfatase activity